MSNMFSGERSVPTILLIIFIVVILVCGISAYVLYTEQARLEKDLATAQESVKKAEGGLALQEQELNDLYKAMGFETIKQIEDMFNSSTATVTPNKLEPLLDALLAKRRELVKKIGVDPKAVDESGKSEFLESTLTAARRAGVVPDSLKGTVVGDLVDQFIRLDKAKAQRADFLTQGEEAVKAVDTSVAAKKQETVDKFKELDGQAAKAWDDRVAEMNRLRVDKPTWDVERLVLAEKRDVEQAINRKLEDRLKLQKNAATPLDGVILSYDWREHRGTVDLGAESRVKAGYEFDVYTVRPGGDSAENRVYRGRIRLLNVGPKASLFTTILSQWDSEERPIMEGQRVCSQLFDNSQRKTFCLKGWFPEGGDHSRIALEGMIFRSGGVVQDELTLDTDFLVIGVASEDGLTNLSAQAKAAVAEGAKAYDEARHLYVTVLTVEKLFKYWDNAGMTVEK